MTNEFKIFFKNLTNIRQILNESVGDSIFIDAINNKKILYIYYAGDDTIMQGYRIIKPFVLGTSLAGNMVLRAWQTEGSSDSFYKIGVNKKFRINHEYSIENSKNKNAKTGTKKPGWRLFRLDKITSVLPTGKNFFEEDGTLVYPEKYNPNDGGMSSIVASIPISREKFVTTSGLGSIVEPDIIRLKGDKKVPSEKQIEEFMGVVTKVKHKSPKKTLVIIDGNDFDLKDISMQDRLNPDTVVGNLHDLYQKYVASKKTTNNELLNQKKREYNIPMNEIKTFFKY